MRDGGDLRRTLRLFGHFTRGQRRAFVIASALLALEALSALAVPDQIKQLTNFLNGSKPPSYFGFRPSADATILVIASVIVVATAVNSASASGSDISLATAGRTLGFNLRGALFAHLQRLPLAFHIRRSSGDVLTRITGDVKAMEDFIEDSFGDLFGSAMILVATMAYLLVQSWQVALLAVVIVPLMTVLSNVFSRRIKKASKQLRASEGELASTAQEMLSTIGLVQVYGRGEFEERKFAAQSRSARDAVLRTSRLEAVFGFMVAVLEAVGIAVVIVVGGRLVSSRTLSSGDLIAFILVIQNMFKPIRRIIKQWNKVASVYASVERVAELLDRQPTVVDAPNAHPAPYLRGEIAFRDVSFAYQSTDDPDDGGARLALQSVSFRIAAGESVALVGHSGAGKSTIAQLLPRLYDPHVGAVTIDGYDVRQFTLDSLRAQMSMVLQETVLLRGTVAENIAYGREGATPQDVVRAAQLANAHEFILNLPDGYDTLLGERAATLSGGQRQRLSIARAFIRDTPILILDEPTTGLDAESSALVSESLLALTRNRSTIIVSHDLNVIRDVDRIFVMSAGQIVEEGSPADLLASGGLYADLYARQFGEAVAAAGAGGAAIEGGWAERPVSPQPEPVPEYEYDYEPEVQSRSAQRAETRKFDTVLTEALPLPASREEYLALTGWTPAVRPGAPGEADLDPLRSPAVTRALPGLAEALDESAMAPRLQRMVAGDWELRSCSPGKPFIEPGLGARVQYRLELRRRSTGESVEQLVAGRLFSSADGAERWLAPLGPSIDAVAGRADLRAIARPVLAVRELCLALHAFPLDPELPGLVAATDPVELVRRLGPLHRGSVPGLLLEDCGVEVARYREGSSVLRYELAWRMEASGRSLKQVVYGKVYGDDRGRLVGPVVIALRQLLDGPGHGLPFLVPRFQTYLPDLRLALLEAMQGSPLLPALIRARARVAGAPPFPGLTPETAVEACARIAAAFHRSSIPVGGTRTLAHELEGMQATVEALAPLAPALAATLRRSLQAVGDLALEAPGPLVACHGDFDASQVLFGGSTASLVDFDTVCLADPALDLGQFTAYLASAVRKATDAAGRAPSGSGDLDAGFLREYVRTSGVSDPEALLARVAAYRTVSLARFAVRNWCRLKPQRVGPTLSLLDDRQPLRVA